MSDEKVLVLRTCNADMTSRDGFVWPESGPVAAPDWDPIPECGNGLHGLLRGEGDGGLLSWDPSAKWLVVEVPAAEIVALDGGAKVKFSRGVVVYAGDRLTATAIVAERHLASAVSGAVRVAGDYGTATAGDYGTATAGYRGTATAGDGGAIAIRYADAPNRLRLAVACVGEDGIKPNVAYRLNPETHRFAEVAK